MNDIIPTFMVVSLVVVCKHRGLCGPVVWQCVDPRANKSNTVVECIQGASVVIVCRHLRFCGV